MALKDVYEPYFALGAAITIGDLEVYSDLITEHFSSVTCGNAMKPERVYAKPWDFAPTEADQLADFARKHDLTMRGHTIVWHQQTPAWFFTEEDSSDYVDETILLHRMTKHLQLMTERYGDILSCSDLVNEAVSDRGDEVLRPSPWRDILGDDYLVKVFKRAKDTVDLPLFYNDYNGCLAQKRVKILRVLDQLKAEGVLPDGIGIQGHWQLNWPSLDEIKQTIESYAAYDIPIHITELDLSIYPTREAEEMAFTKELEEIQARRYEEIFTLFRAYSKEIENVTFWGVSDGMTWLDNFPQKGRKNYPLLFDAEGELKLAGKRLLAIE